MMVDHHDNCHEAISRLTIDLHEAIINQPQLGCLFAIFGPPYSITSRRPGSVLLRACQRQVLCELVQLLVAARAQLELLGV